MQIQELISAKLPVSNKLAKTQKPQSQQSFDQVFAKLNRIEEQRPTRQEQNTTKETTQPNETPPVTQSETTQDKPIQNETITEEVEVITPELELDIEIADEILAAIAQVLNVPVEVIEEWTIAYEIAPEEMIDPENTIKLIQSALDVETPIELLTEPEYPEMIKAVTEAVEPFKAIILQETVKPIQNTTQLSQLEVINEDGEIIVTPETVELITEVEQIETTIQPVVNRPVQAETAAPEVETPIIIETVENIQTPEVIDFTTQIRTNADIALRQAIQQPVPIDNTDVINQIMNQVRVVSQGGNFTEMRLTLRPEALGDIELRLVTIAGIVTAQFTAESQRVKEMLESSFNNLRDALTEQGIQFADISVSVRQEGSEAANQFEYARRNTRQRAENITEVEEEQPPEPQADLDSGSIVSLTA